MNKKLQEIGNKLNISERDIKKIQRGSISTKFLVIIIGGIIVIIAFVLWLVIRKEIGPSPTPPGYPYTPPSPTPTPTPTPIPPPGGGYPFAPPLIIGGFLSYKKKNSKIAGLLISAISFLASLIGTPVFGQAILYNVFKKNSKITGLLTSAVVFLFSLIAIPVFGQAIKYNVYSRK